MASANKGGSPHSLRLGHIVNGLDADRDESNPAER